MELKKKDEDEEDEEDEVMKKKKKKKRIVVKHCASMRSKKKWTILKWSISICISCAELVLSKCTR